MEFLKPYPALYCAEHARDHLEDPHAADVERPDVPFWVPFGAKSAEEYTRWCEESASVLHEMVGHTQKPGAPGLNHVLYHVLDEARTHLQRYELPRARKALMAGGGTPRLTASERDILAFWRECVDRWGEEWTDRGTPPRVVRFQEWERAEAEADKAACGAGEE